MTDDAQAPVPTSGAPQAAQEPSARPPDRLPVSATPRPPAERRERRRAVEAALVGGATMERACADLAPRFGVHPTTIRSDARRVVRRWAREDRRTGTVQRSRVLRRVLENANRCRDLGDLAGERQALGLLARLLGMLVPAPAVAIDARSVTANVGVDWGALRRAAMSAALDSEARAAALTLTQALARKLPSADTPIPQPVAYLNGAAHHGD